MASSLSVSALALGWLATGAAALRATVPGTFASLQQAERKPPSLPSSYEVHYNFTLPYTKAFLPEAITYPCKLYIDNPNALYKLDVYNGMDKEYKIGGVDYLVGPRIHEEVCLINGDPAGGGPSVSGPNLAAQPQRAAAPPISLHKGALPDLADWTFVGDVEYNGQPAEKWAYNHTLEQTVSKYEFTLTHDGVPLYLHMLGSELLTESHFDEYEAVFTAFIPGPLDVAAVFTLPEICSKAEAVTGHRSQSVHMALLNPLARLERSEYDRYHGEQGREHTSVSDYALRSSLYLHHSTAIKAHNLRPEPLYKLVVNRYADWTDDEYTSLLGYRGSGLAERQEAAARKLLSSDHDDEDEDEDDDEDDDEDVDDDEHEVAHKKDHRKYGKHKHKERYTQGKGFQGVPASVDWRESGAVGVVKDQSVCGSCWTFSASQAMSAAWWLQTGDFVSLAEQQLMDCAWDYGYNGGCDGGDPDLAMLYVIEAGGGAYSEKDWPYKGEDAFCKTGAGGKLLDGFKALPSAQFSKVVYIDMYDSEGLQHALYHNGPISIALDANPNAFRFYSSGVIKTDECNPQPEGLDHAIMVVGYGEEAGEPYWLVKNEWSAHWGDGGYAKLSREKDCGVSTAAVFPVADKDAVKAWKEARSKRTAA